MYRQAHLGDTCKDYLHVPDTKHAQCVKVMISPSLRKYIGRFDELGGIDVSSGSTVYTTASCHSSRGIGIVQYIHSGILWTGGELHSHVG